MATDMHLNVPIIMSQVAGVMVPLQLPVDFERRIPFWNANV